uniref:Protein-arginine deiminase n=1 Tax=Pelusios castaneus TaxID=367368 RepID=A0A8C8VJX9_9SAUR
TSSFMNSRQYPIRPTAAMGIFCIYGDLYTPLYPRSIPSGAISFDARGTAEVRVYVVYYPNAVRKPAGAARWPLSSEVEVVVTMDVPSSTINDSKVRISYYGQKGNAPIEGAWLYLTCVSKGDSGWGERWNSGSLAWSVFVPDPFVFPLQTKWTWGPNGQGAVLLVNCDKDSPGAKDMDSTMGMQKIIVANAYVFSFQDLQDMSLMILRIQGPEAIFAAYKLVLDVSESDVDKVRVFHASGNDSFAQYKHVLGSGKRSYVVDHDSRQENTFYVEGLAFPDADFSGLVSFSVTLLENVPDTPVFTDTVVFQVSPWIMTPNTLQPVEVFVYLESNEDFLEALSTLVRKANCKLTICPEVENRGDRWIQDEMEFGYIQAPHKTFPVVFDSPRDRGLRDFPFRRILGPDFGYVTRRPPKGHVSSLDSFGNLDVSPPVTVKGKEYPLGRILIGSSLPRSGGRKMTKAVRDFLYAQKVQPPLELYSDWLTVGHIDEFLSFVPAPDRKGFRLLLASPNACYKLLTEKQREGHGNAAQFAGEGAPGGSSLLTFFLQSCIDWNRQTIKEELGLTEQDIIDIPQLFVLNNSRADAFFPDLVNMIVLGKHLGIPKPFGPIINQQCCLEENVRSLLEPLGLICTFIDDFFSYHTLLGEVHCGTNVLRKPFSFKWWNMIP